MLMFSPCFYFMGLMLQNDHVVVTTDIIFVRTRVLHVFPYVSMVAHHVRSKMACRTHPYRTERVHTRYSCVHQLVLLTVFDRKSTPNMSTNTFQPLPWCGCVPPSTVDDVSVVLRMFRFGSGASVPGFDASPVHNQFVDL